jgi:hypothetical protein
MGGDVVDRVARPQARPLSKLATELAGIVLDLDSIIRRIV